MNDTVSRNEIVACVTTSGILAKHRANNAYLDRLLAVTSQSPDIQQAQSDIAISSSPDLPASHYEQIYRRRLRFIPDRPDTDQLRVAVTQLVDYCASHSEASICSVTLNCSEQSYTVFCGRVGTRLNAICVVVGKHIPDYARQKR